MVLAAYMLARVRGVLDRRVEAKLENVLDRLEGEVEVQEESMDALRKFVERPSNSTVG